MAVNGSTLQIEVVSKGIQETVQRLDSLGNAAGRNEGRIKLLTDSLGMLMTAQDNAVSKSSQHAMLMNAIAQQMGLAADAAKEVSSSVTKLNKDLDALTDSSEKTNKALQRKSTSAGIVTRTLEAMTAAAMAYVSINFAKGIVESADAWRTMQARLKLATGSMEEAKVVQNNLFNTAQALRVPLDDIGRLYTRMAIPMQRMGMTAKQTGDQVEFVALALKLSGATAAEASSVMLQYSQSVNAGRLNGAEFNAVAEGAPLILRAIEAELKATGQWSEFSGKSLKKMGADGEITFELIRRAAIRALPQMREDFNSLPLTVDGALQRVKNAWFKAMGEMGEKTEMGVKLAKAIGQLEAAIPAIRDNLAATFVFLHDNFGKIIFAIEAIIAVKFVAWIWSTTAALHLFATVAAPKAIAAFAATSVGAGITTVAVGALGMAIRALESPWGIALALINTAVFAWSHFSEKAVAAEEAVTAATEVQTVSRLKLLQNEIDKLNERNGIATKTAIVEPNAGLHPEIQVQLDGLIKLRTAQSLMSKDGSEASKAAISGIQQTIDMRQREFDVMMAQDQAKNTIRDSNLEAIRQNKLAGLEEEMGLKTADKQKKFETELKKWTAKFAELKEKMPASLELALKIKIFGEEKIDKIDHFANQISSLKAYTEELEIYLATEEKATRSEKTRAAYDSGKNKDYNKMSPKQKAATDEVVAFNRELEKQAALRDGLNKAVEEAATATDRDNKKLTDGIAVTGQATLKIREQITAVTESKSAAKDMAAAQLEKEASQATSLAMDELENNGLTKQYDLLLATAKAKRDLAIATKELGIAQDTKEANDELKLLLDPKRALNFGTTLKEAFGSAGDAIEKMTLGLGTYGKMQERIDLNRKKILTEPLSAKRTADLEALDKRETESKLRAYGDMAAGAKGFFKENTAGYKVMHTAEQAFRIAEMAMAIEASAVKVWASLTAAGAKKVETVADVEYAAVDTAISGGLIASSVARAAAFVSEGAAKMFGQGGFAGFAGVAAMVGVLAGLGLAVSGGGGGGGASFDLKARQSSQGTGTVLGDSAAKSDSLNKAMTSLENNSNIGLVLTTNMLSSLRGIEASMQGLASAIFKTTGMTTGKNFGITEGKSLGGLGGAISGFLGGMFGGALGSIFGGNTSTSISDTGLALNGRSSDFKNGQGASQYADVHTQTDGGWFGSDSSSDERRYMAASNEITTTIGRVFESINETISKAAVALGANGESIKAAMDSYVISTEISLKGLVGDQLQQALNSVFAASSDNIARNVFPGLEAFQKAGEGYYQTLIRVSTGTEQAQNALNTFGVQMVGRDSLINKTGDIALELVRQSVMAANAGSTISDIMRVMSGTMSDLVVGYKTLLNIRDTMRAAALGQDVSINTIRGAGGLTELQSSLQGFVKGFFTAAEASAISFSNLRAEFGRLNVAMPSTTAGFRILVTSLMAGDAASQEMAGRVLSLGTAFADAFTEAETARKTAIDAAKTNLNDAYTKENDALKAVISSMSGFTTALSAFKTTLITGDLSTKSSSEKYATAKLNYDDVSTRANAGDKLALADFERSASELLKQSKAVNASGVGYTADYERVLAETEALRAYTSTQVDVATASLTALQEQVKGLLDVNKSVMSVTDAIVALHLAMAAVNPAMAINGSHANGLSNVPFDGYIAELHRGEAVLTASENSQYKAGGVNFSRGGGDEALCNEIRALRDEVRQLKEEQREQTSNLIVANYDSSERNAHKVVEGAKGAMEDMAYSERSKTKVV